MIRPSGGRGPGFDSPLSPLCFVFFTFELFFRLRLTCPDLHLPTPVQSQLSVSGVARFGVCPRTLQAHPHISHDCPHPHISPRPPSQTAPHAVDAVLGGCHRERVSVLPVSREPEVSGHATLSRGSCQHSVHKARTLQSAHTALYTHAALLLDRRPRPAL